MKKISVILIALFIASGSYAQCVIDSSLLLSSTGGFYPDALHLPHIVQDSFYSQTVQGKIEQTMSVTYTYMGFPIQISITVDSVRLDTINGLPYGINWTKSANAVVGGGYGCILFSGTTPDGAGTYTPIAEGKVWARIAVPPLFDKDTFMTLPLSQVPAYRGFYFVVDSAPSALRDSAGTQIGCGSPTAGTATVYPLGGSQVDPYNYLWSNGATTYTINNVAAGTYYVTITSGIDTILDSVTVLVDPIPLVLVTSTDSGSTGANGSAAVNVTGGIPPYMYNWNNGATTDSISGLAPGNYHVNVTDSLGCTQNANARVINLVNGIANTTETKPQISLFPNPTNSQLNVVIQSPVAINSRLEVIDITGKTVYSSAANISTTRFSQVIDVKTFSPGMYILQLTSDNQSLHQRFVVTK